MVVGWGIIDIVVEGSRSLKEKRSVVRRILGRTKNTFNVSIAEVGAYNDWKRCQIGFSVVGNERGFVQSKMDKIANFIEGLHLADVIHVTMELCSISPTRDGCGDYIIDEFQES